MDKNNDSPAVDSTPRLVGNGFLHESAGSGDTLANGTDSMASRSNSRRQRSNHSSRHGRQLSTISLRWPMRRVRCPQAAAAQRPARHRGKDVETFATTVGSSSFLRCGPPPRKVTRPPRDHTNATGPTEAPPSRTGTLPNDQAQRSQQERERCGFITNSNAPGLYVRPITTFTTRRPGDGQRTHDG